jgi:hypothetical protein
MRMEYQFEDDAQEGSGKKREHDIATAGRDLVDNDVLGFAP